MRSFVRLAVSFFVLCLLIFLFVYVFGPPKFREAVRAGHSPVGQLGIDAELTTPGPPDKNK